MKLKQKKNAVTFLELTAVLIILSFAIPGLLMMFSEANFKSVGRETLATASLYAQELMEEIRSKSFSDPDQTPVFGLEQGETERSDFDDVDDYNGFLDNPSPTFARSVSVIFMELNLSSWQQAASPPTDYKSITVTVQDLNNSISPISLEVLVSDY